MQDFLCSTLWLDTRWILNRLPYNLPDPRIKAYNKWVAQKILVHKKLPWPSELENNKHISNNERKN